MSKSIVSLSKKAIAINENAREARWNLGIAVLNEFYQKIGGELVTNKSLDKDAPTVAEFAKDNCKEVGKSFGAYKVFLSEAKNFAVKHKTLASALKDPIKSESVDKPFNVATVVAGLQARYTPAELKKIKARL